MMSRPMERERLYPFNRFCDCEACQTVEHLDSTLDMAFSPTPSVPTSIHMQLLFILDRLERSVSLEEKTTDLKEYISMLSLCSNESSPLGTAGPLTSQVATQILSQATAHLKMVGTMRRKMATLSEEASSGRAEETYQYAELVLCGLKSSWQRLETSFLDFARIWTLDHCVSITPVSERTRIGSIDWTALLTPIQVVLSAQQTTCLLSIDGHMQILATAKEVRNFHGWGKAPQRAEQSSAPRADIV